MGRTQATYRMRLQQLQQRLMKYDVIDRSTYQKLWEITQRLSAPASTLPYFDTHAIASFCMILDAISQIEELASQLD